MLPNKASGLPQTRQGEPPCRDQTATQYAVRGAPESREEVRIMSPMAHERWGDSQGWLGAQSTLGGGCCWGSQLGKRRRNLGGALIWEGCGAPHFSLFTGFAESFEGCLLQQPKKQTIANDHLVPTLFLD